MMTIEFKHIMIFVLVFIGLIGLNVYQWQNPSVVEAPSGTEQIDSTAWVQRTVFTERGVIIDSLKAQNKDLTKRLKESGDEIAQYTRVNGRLRLAVDSLENEYSKWYAVPDLTSVNDSSFLEKARNEYQQLQSLMDSTFITHRQFGDGLFLVTGLVEFRGNQFRQHLSIEQLRDIRIDVATTVSEDKRRILTFVTSKDFESLKYESFTELKPRKKLPKFWIGLAIGVAGTAYILK